VEFHDLDAPDQLPRAMFVLALVLLGLLEFMAAGSKFLIGSLHGTVQDWGLSTVLLSLIGSCFLVLAHGVWHLRSWAPLFTSLLTVLVIAFSVFRVVQDDVFDLALALVFVLSMLTNLSLLVWLLLPENQPLWQNNNDSGDAAGPQDRSGNAGP
jgi:hypothetical protein